MNTSRNIIRYLLNPNINNNFLLKPIYNHRPFSIIPNKNPNFMHTRHADVTSPLLVSNILDIIKINKDCYRSKLDMLVGVKMTKRSVSEVFGVLRCEKVLALEFFHWVRANNADLYRCSDVCSLMVENCGWVDDWDTMRVLLRKFKDERVCLNDKAFGFLPVIGSSKARGMEHVERVVNVLNEVGGSVRSSGVFELIGMLCGISEFELAKYVIGVTERKVGYYGVLVREKCRRGCLDEAYGLIGEMRVEGCEPDVKIYNYVLGGLCKSDKISEGVSLLEEMTEKGVDPDEITFEIFITSSCRLGRMEFANESLKRLMHTGRPTRVSTHGAIVKGYHKAGRYDEAYAYVRDLEEKNLPVVNKLYSLLARLHQKKGNVDVARRIFNEMMEKGLKPDFVWYAKTVNMLRHTGGRDLARDLQKNFSKFRIE